LATYSEIQDRVERRLIDLPAAVLAEVPDLVNKAHREIQRRHNFKVMRATQSNTTLVDTRTLVTAIPSDFKQLRSKPWFVSNEGFRKEIGIAPDELALAREFETDDDGEPEFILEPACDDDTCVSEKWEVWPLPDGNSDYDDGEYRLVIPYWKYLPAYSADADSDWFSVNADWYITFKATAEGFFVDWDEQRGAFWEQKATNELSQLILASKHDILAPIDTLVPHRGAHAPQLKA